MRERKGTNQKKLKCSTFLARDCRMRGGKLSCRKTGLWGVSCKPQWKQTTGKWSHSLWKQFSRYTLRRLSVLPISLPSFVRPGQQRDAWSLCWSVNRVELLETEGDAHTRTHSLSLSLSLSLSHTLSLSFFVLSLSLPLSLIFFFSLSLSLSPSQICCLLWKQLFSARVSISLQV